MGFPLGYEFGNALINLANVFRTFSDPAATSQQKYDGVINGLSAVSTALGNVVSTPGAAYMTGALGVAISQITEQSQTWSTN